MIKDTKINELFGVPTRTLQDMKNRDKTNWRYKVYTFLKSQSEETIKSFFQEEIKKQEITKKTLF